MTAMTDIAKEYGTALFSLAFENESTEEFSKSLREITSILKENDEYIELLSSPNIPISKRLSLLDEVFGETCPEYVLSFLKLICEKGRIAVVFDAIEEFEELLAASKRVLNVRVTSAIELSSLQKEGLQKALEKNYRCSVNIDYSIDASILGGIVVESEDKRLDGSVLNRLQQVKEVIST